MKERRYLLLAEGHGYLYSSVPITLIDVLDVHGHHMGSGSTQPFQPTISQFPGQPENCV